MATLYDYRMAQKLVQEDDAPFYALIMAALWRADDVDQPRLRDLYPDLWAELVSRYHAPGGRLPQDGATAIDP